MKIGELAKATLTPVETIRYYEHEQLLSPASRSEGNYRLYGPEHVQRLGFIRHCRSLDMTLGEIRVLLSFKDDPQAACADVNALLDAHIGHVATRIRELKQLEKQLRQLRESCSGVTESVACGILSGIGQAAAAPPAGAPQAGSGHVHGAHGQAGAKRTTRQGRKH